MSFDLLQGKRGAGADLSYSVCAGTPYPKLKFMLDGALMSRLGWDEKTRVQLHLGKDEDAGKARLVQVQTDGRKLGVHGMQGRAHVEFTWTTNEEPHFPNAQMEALEVVNECISGYVEFKLPGLPDMEGAGV